MSKWAVVPRSDAANESLSALPRAHAHAGTCRVKNNTSNAFRPHRGLATKPEELHLFDWKQWMSSDDVRSPTKAFFKPRYRCTDTKRIGVAVMSASNSAQDRRGPSRRGTRGALTHKCRLTNAQKDNWYYCRVLKMLKKMRKRQMQNRAAMPASEKWWQVLERLDPVDAYRAIKDLKTSTQKKLMETHWFSELQNLLEEAGKKCVPKEKPAPAVGDDDSEGFDLPELSTAMLDEVTAVLKSEPASEVLVSGFRLHITRSDIRTLNEGSWLNDEVINFYLSLIMERSGSEEAKTAGWPRVYTFNTFFYQKLAASGYAAVKRWTRSVDIFSFDILLVPLHCSMHWCLAAVDFRKRTIHYYDSLMSKGDKGHFLLQLRSYVEDESQGKKKESIDWKAWELIVAEDAPQQKNTSDCGVFICQYSECLSRDAPFAFEQQHMPYFRKRMVFELLYKSILSV